MNIRFAAKLNYDTSIYMLPKSLRNSVMDSVNATLGDTFQSEEDGVSIQMHEDISSTEENRKYAFTVQTQVEPLNRHITLGPYQLDEIVKSRVEQIKEVLKQAIETMKQAIASHQEFAREQRMNEILGRPQQPVASPGGTVWTDAQARRGTIAERPEDRWANTVYRPDPS